MPRQAGGSAATAADGPANPGHGHVEVGVEGPAACSRSPIQLATGPGWAPTAG
ncbi:hypothetical protein [Micromonospora sp. NBC_00858]|uniref:hypothetical protein n=1 Tax=Micromonospora sp. NBC_00858 TaxID=2975979 RepID=UPI0038688E74|nr:hypothetical protein OG990_16745 [Micromonospora sp. NBC_00858]